MPQSASEKSKPLVVVLVKLKVHHKIRITHMPPMLNASLVDGTAFVYHYPGCEIMRKKWWVARFSSVIFQALNLSQEHLLNCAIALKAQQFA